jgi:hypothetical protein
MRTSPLVRRTLSALTFLLVCASAAPSGAASKPARYDVPGGATVLYFTSFATPASGASATAGTITVTNVTVIAKIRALINALPVSDTRNRFCPDDLLVPSYVSFAATASTAPFAKVMFQLGGCPFARVYQHGVATSPALGGTHLGLVFSEIKRLVGDQAS